MSTSEAQKSLISNGLHDNVGRVYDSPFDTIIAGQVPAAVFGVNGALSSDWKYRNATSLIAGSPTDVPGEDNPVSNIREGLQGRWVKRDGKAVGRNIPNRIREVAAWRGALGPDGSPDPDRLIITNCYLLATGREGDVIRGIEGEKLLKASMAFHEQITFPALADDAVIVVHGAQAAETFYKRYAGQATPLLPGRLRVFTVKIGPAGHKRPFRVLATPHFSRAPKFQGTVRNQAEALLRDALASG